MAALRTQVYLTREQRRLLDQRARVEHKTLAQVIRDAIDAYVRDASPPSRTQVLDATFGALRELEIPAREECDRGYG